MKISDVLKMMDEIQRVNFAPQTWFPQLRRLLEQAQASEEAQVDEDDSKYYNDSQCPICHSTFGHRISCPRG